jgi:hypothetical protein
VGGAKVQPPPGQAHLVGGRGPGLLLLTALVGYTVKNAWKSDIFFSWSYFSGWLAFPFSILAGNLHSGKRVDTAQRTPSPRDSPVALPGNLTVTSQHTPLQSPANPAETPPGP